MHDKEAQAGRQTDRLADRQPNTDRPMDRPTDRKGEIVCRRLVALQYTMVKYSVTKLNGNLAFLCVLICAASSVQKTRSLTLPKQSAVL